MAELAQKVAERQIVLYENDIINICERYGPEKYQAAAQQCERYLQHDPDGLRSQAMQNLQRRMQDTPVDEVMCEVRVSLSCDGSVPISGRTKRSYTGAHAVKNYKARLRKARKYCVY